MDVVNNGLWTGHRMGNELGISLSMDGAKNGV